MDELLRKDIEKKLKIKIANCDIHYFTEGATDSIVFSIDNSYLIKTFTENEFDVQLEFLNKYKNKYFQKIVYANRELYYICFNFVDGRKFNLKDINVKDALDDIYDITSNYSKYEYNGYGYLFSDYNKSWKQFLNDEVMYSKQEIEAIDVSKVEEAINIIGGYHCDKYLIHGDFGVHNFLISNGRIRVIDPMGVVGDPLYDFYFAILSDSDIYMQLDVNQILEYFDRDMEYKRALFLIVLYIRMSRAHKYDIDSFDNYINLYERFRIKEN